MKVNENWGRMFVVAFRADQLCPQSETRYKQRRTVCELADLLLPRAMWKFYTLFIALVSAKPRRTCDVSPWKYIKFYKNN